jgi:1,4-alpha-glucan branching enzyme
LIFAFNFHPTQSYTDYHVAAAPGRYQMILDSDAKDFGGHGRLDPDQEHVAPVNTSPSTDRSFLSLYLPNRTVIVLRKI